MHFRTRPDQELECEKRNELIKVLQKLFMEQTTKNLPIYGVSTRILKDFLTSEKDQLRQITRMPT